MKVENQCLAAALAAFPYEGKIVAMEQFGSGHINDTYAVFVEGYPHPRIGYILQRLNTHVFKKPQEVMENIMGVTEFMHTSLESGGEDCERGVLHFLKTNDGDVAYYDIQGMPWRSYRFIEHSFCFDQSSTPEIFYQSGRAFGNFLGMLGGYPAETLHETIPDFHDTRWRYQSLLNAVEKDSLGRAKECRAEIEFALERQREAGLLMELLEAGELPLRVTHNDTKLNNVLFDTQTKRAICVIDLDTIMPGLSASDFGDAIRFGASTAAEDEINLNKVKLSLPLFEAFTKGYLETVGFVLTPKEKEVLPEGARIITLECGVRFLTDYLEGDSYFKTERPGQNLDRCRTQFKLVQEIENNMETLHEIVQKHSMP